MGREGLANLFNIKSARDGGSDKKCQLTYHFIVNREEKLMNNVSNCFTGAMYFDLKLVLHGFYFKIGDDFLTVFLSIKKPISSPAPLYRT